MRACFCFCSCSGSAAGGRQRQHTGQNGKAAEDAKGDLYLISLDLFLNRHLRAAVDIAAGAVAVRQQIKANETKLALGVLGGFAVLAGVLALATSGG